MNERLADRMKQTSQQSINHPMLIVLRRANTKTKQKLASVAGVFFPSFSSRFFFLLLMKFECDDETKLGSHGGKELSGKGRIYLAFDE